MICIVVDHPTRDLPSIINLVSIILKKDKNKKIFLVHMYDVDRFLSTDYGHCNFILFNFFRKENRYLIIKAVSHGIKVGVLDQEGAAGNDCHDIIRSIRKVEKDLRFVNLFCHWGKSQMIEFKKKFYFHPKKNFVSGCIKFDIVKKSNNKKKKYILINTNFPLISPKFNSLNNEIDTMVNNGKGSKKEVLEMAKSIYERREKFYKLLEKILNDYPNENFVIRPHPYENGKYWKKLLKFKNLNYNENNSSLTSLKSAKFLIHINSTTSLEAKLIGIPALSASWLLKKNEKYVITENSSINSNSEKDFKKKFNYLLKNYNKKLTKDFTKIKKYMGDININNKNTNKLASKILNISNQKKADHEFLKLVYDAKKIISNRERIINLRNYFFSKEVSSSKEAKVKNFKKISKKISFTDFEKTFKKKNIIEKIYTNSFFIYSKYSN